MASTKNNDPDEKLSTETGNVHTTPDPKPATMSEPERGLPSTESVPKPGTEHTIWRDGNRVRVRVLDDGTTEDIT